MVTVMSNLLEIICCFLLFSFKSKAKVLTKDENIIPLEGFLTQTVTCIISGPNFKLTWLSFNINRICLDHLFVHCGLKSQLLVWWILRKLAFSVVFEVFGWNIIGGRTRKKVSWNILWNIKPCWEVVSSFSRKYEKRSKLCFCAAVTGTNIFFNRFFVMFENFRISIFKNKVCINHPKPSG